MLQKIFVGRKGFKVSKVDFPTRKQYVTSSGFVRFFYQNIVSKHGKYYWKVGDTKCRVFSGCPTFTDVFSRRD